VIHAGKGDRLRPVCCNQPMILMEKLTEIYHCPVCGSEVAVLRLKSESIGLVCCNVPMQASVKRVA